MGAAPHERVRRVTRTSCCSTEAETLPAWVASAYAYRGQEDNAVDLLEEDYAQRESRLWEIKSDPLLDHNPFAVAVSR